MSQPSISVICYPYFNGRRLDPTGYLVAQGAAELVTSVPDALREVFQDVSVTMLDTLDEWVQPPNAPRPVVPGDQLIRQLYQSKGLSAAVQEARDAGRFPVVFSGGCTSSLGMVGGCNDDKLGMFWFDAHPDDNSPDNTVNGLFEGMPVSIIAGECFPNWRRQIPGFHPINHQRISMIGLHDRSNWVVRPDRRDGVGHLVDPAAIKKWGYEKAMRRAVEQVSERAEAVYVHIDWDVLDISVLDAPHSVAGGLTAEQLVYGMRLIAEHVAIKAINFTDYDLGKDPDGAKILPGIVTDILKAIVSGAEKLKNEQHA